MPDCERCQNTGKLRFGQHCPSCTHVIEWPVTPSSRARLNILHVVKCSCGWRHSETSRQNALGRAAKMRGAVSKHLGGLK